MTWSDKVIENPNTPNYQLGPNPVMQVDSYKASHFLQYPENFTHMFDYVESRGGRYGSTVFFGLQYFLKQYLCTQVTREHVEEAKSFFEAHGEPFPYEGWMRVVTHHDGNIPIHIRAVPEGSVVPTGNILVSVESTDDQIPWMVSWFETALLRAIWYPTTVATKSYYCKKVILEALEKSSDDPLGELYFKLHDFGARGASSGETAAIGGMAHLVNFQGSDTVEGIRFANHFYNCAMAAFSIPAAEHSTMTIKGEKGELDQMRRMLEQFAKPGALLACVSDSYDIYRAVESYWGEELHDMVRDSGATVVIRPDSGDPAEVNLEILRILERKIGMRKNMKGYKVLPKYFRLIQGDGNDNEDSLRKVLNALHAEGYSSSNIAFGMGGGLLQLVNRDTQKFAMKCSQATIDNEVLEVRKNPVTDRGKQSKAGLLDLVHRNGSFQTVQGRHNDSCLWTVYKDGELIFDQHLEDIRKRSESGLF